MFDRFYGYFLLLLTAVAAYACAPLPYVYHEPSAPGEKLVHSLCAQFAPKDTIEFQIEGTKTQITAGDNRLLINVYVPEGKLAQFMSDEIALYEGKLENAKHFRITRAAYYDGEPTGYVAIKPTDHLIGRTKPLVKYGLAGDRLFEMSVQLDEKEKNHFFVRLPGIRIGEQLHEFPVIEFIKKTGVGIMPVNC